MARRRNFLLLFAALCVLLGTESKALGQANAPEPPASAPAPTPTPGETPSSPGSQNPGSKPSPAEAPAAPVDPNAITPPKLMAFVDAGYPEEARAAKLEAQVLLLLTVGADGF